MGDTPALREDNWVLSLVPTQLQRLLGLPAAVDWLRRFRVIFVGGGPIWPTLADAGQEAGLRLSISYGSTETAAMIAALRPEEFAAGARSCGAVMPHARVRIDETDQVLSIAGESVFRGYWPEWNNTREITTEDIGRFDERGHLHILGRRDAMIVTGAKKVQPAEVEAALRASGEFSDVAVIGVPDHEWGEIVVACYPRMVGREPDTIRATAALMAFQRPKKLVAIAEWPRNAQGKVNRAALRAMVMAEQKSTRSVARIE
jgi:O-succinylbenzoic acid--CoA ligase